jgi:hypothetical protein
MPSYRLWRLDEFFEVRCVVEVIENIGVVKEYVFRNVDGLVWCNVVLLYILGHKL